MRTNSRLILILILIVVLSLACSRSVFTGTQPVSDEEYVVYLATFEYFSGGSAGLYVVKDHTDTFGEVDDDTIKYLQEDFLSEVDQRALNAFQANNQDSYELGEFSEGVNVHLLSTDEFNTSSDLGDRWEAFYEAYPEASGIFVVSRVGFNKDRDQAVVCVGLQSYYLAGQGYYFFLEKINGVWQIQDVLMAWVS